MIAAMLHGVFVVWRHGTDKETIYEWGVYQLNDQGKLEAQVLNYVPEVICEARVPIFGAADDPRAIDQTNIDVAIKVLTDDLVDQVRKRGDLAGIRAQLGRVADKGKPRPPVEVIDEHDWAKLWSTGVGF
jgi:hypothetical protein